MTEILTPPTWLPSRPQATALRNIATGNARYRLRGLYWTAPGRPNVRSSHVDELRAHGLVRSWQAATGPTLCEITDRGRQVVAWLDRPAEKASAISNRIKRLTATVDKASQSLAQLRAQLEELGDR